jgi:hypothetical protein
LAIVQSCFQKRIPLGRDYPVGAQLDRKRNSLS